MTPNAERIARSRAKRQKWRCRDCSNERELNHTLCNECLEKRRAERAAAYRRRYPHCTIPYIPRT